MKESRWSELKEVFQRALEGPVEERERVLEEAGDDPGLRAELEALLLAHDEAGPATGSGVDLPPEAAPGEAPDTIGPYRIVQEVGRGGMGVVYEAEQVSMARRVALKVLTPSLTSAGRSVQRFKVEARAAGRLHHTNIVPVYDMGQHGGHWYYAMELIEGWPLNRIVDELRAGGERAASCRLDVESSRGGGGDDPGSASEADWYRTVAAMFAGVADALAAAHEESIVHRDVKPGNLLLHTDGTLKLVDFGLAHLDDNGPQMTRTGDVLGTPAYMSPEQAESRRERVDHRTDIYSLGATLYEVLTLAPPFDGASLAELCTKIASSDPLAPRRIEPGIPKDLENIVQKAMEKDPGRRYASAAELARDLRAFSVGDAVRARRVGVLGRWSRRVKRHKTVSALTAAAVLLAAGATWLTWQLAEADRRERYDRLIAGAQRVSGADGNNADLFAGYEALLGGDAKPLKELLAGAIAIDPERQEAYWLRALAPGKYEARLRDVEAAVERGASTGTAHWLRSHLLTLAGRLSEAEAERQRALAAQEAETPTSLYVRARIEARAARSDEALALLSTAIEASERRGLVHHLALSLRAQIFERVGRTEDALSDLLAQRALGYRSPTGEVRIAVLWHKLGRPEAAEASLGQALDLARTSATAKWWISLMVRAQEGLADRPELAQRVASACVEACTASIAERQGDAPAHGARAYALHVLQRDDEALARCEEAIELLPDSAHLRATYGELLFEADRKEEALENFRAAVEKQPMAPTHQVNLGVVLNKLGRVEEAIAVHRATLARWPDERLGHLNLADALKKLGRTDEAIASCEAALELSYDWQEGHRGLVDVLQHFGRFEEAIAALRREMDLRPKDAWASHKMAELLQATGQAEAAIAALRAAIVLDPDLAGAHADLGALLWAGGERDEALEALRRGARLAYYYPFAWRRLVRDPNLRNVSAASFGALESSDKAPGLEQAVEALEAAIASDPDSTFLHWWLAVTYGGLQRRPEAVAPLREAVRLAGLSEHADDAKLFRNLGGALGNAGAHEDAIAPLTRAAELAPNNATSHYNLGTVLNWTGRHEEAAVALRRAVELDRYYPEAWANLGHAFLELERYAEAVEPLRTAVELGPQIWLAHYKLCVALRLCGQLDEAIDAARAALQHHDRWEIHYQLGRAFQEAGRLDEALDAFQRTLVLNPGYKWALRLVAAIHATSGRGDEALRSLSEAIDNGLAGAEGIESDASFDSIRDDPRFAEQLDRIRE